MLRFLTKNAREPPRPNPGRLGQRLPEATNGWDVAAHGTKFRSSGAKTKEGPRGSPGPKTETYGLPVRFECGWRPLRSGLVRGLDGGLRPLEIFLHGSGGPSGRFSQGSGRLLTHHTVGTPGKKNPNKKKKLGLPSAAPSGGDTSLLPKTNLYAPRRSSQEPGLPARGSSTLA